MGGEKDFHHEGTKGTKEAAPRLRLFCSGRLIGGRLAVKARIAEVTVEEFRALHQALDAARGRVS